MISCTRAAAASESVIALNREFRIGCASFSTGFKARRAAQDIASIRQDSQTASRLQRKAPAHSRAPRNRSALAITLTEESAIAAAAMTGDSIRPNTG